MPLELDDREPPEDDPDAPAPAVSLLRHSAVPLIRIETRAASAAERPVADIASWHGGSAQAAPAAGASARTCFLMRARRTLDDNTVPR